MVEIVEPDDLLERDACLEVVVNDVNHSPDHFHRPVTITHQLSTRRSAGFAPGVVCASPCTEIGARLKTKSFTS